MNSLRIGSVSIFSALILAGALGCGGTGTPATSANAYTPATNPNTLPSASGGTTATTSASMDNNAASMNPNVHATTAPAAAPIATADAPLSDEQIAAVIATANTGEIDQARLAVATTKNTKVKKFAEHMIKAHTEANVKENKLLATNHFEQSANGTSNQLANNSSSLMDSLRQKTGADFDKAYIDAQVNEHQQVLDTIDNKILPTVKNDDLKSYVQAMRAKVTEHLKDAQDIQKSL